VFTKRCNLDYRFIRHGFPKFKIVRVWITQQLLCSLGLVWFTERWSSVVYLVLCMFNRFLFQWVLELICSCSIVCLTNSYSSRSVKLNVLHTRCFMQFSCSTTNYVNLNLAPRARHIERTQE
jgi:hypothetical protein